MNKSDTMITRGGKVYLLKEAKLESGSECDLCAFDDLGGSCISAIGSGACLGEGQPYWAEAEDKPQTESDGWVEWGGGERPVSGETIVEYVMRDDALGGESYEDRADELRWDNFGGAGDIVRYRVISGKPSAPVGEKPTNPKDAIGIRKAPMSTIPMGVVAELGVAMLEGSAKYGRHNYRGVGVRGSVYFDATMRHLISWWEGEDIDPDSGMSHITKAIASLAVLRDAQMQSKLEDDRPPASKPFYQALHDAAGKVLDKHADKSPKHWTNKDSV